MCAAQMQLGPEAKSLNLVVCFAKVVSQGNSYFLTAAAAVLHEDSVTMPCLSTTALIRRNYATAASTTAVSGLLQKHLSSA